MLQGKIPSDVISKRQQYLNGMKKFLESQKQKLQEAVDKLGLDLSNLSEVPKKQVCPYNTDHVVPEDAFKKHCEQCSLLTAGTSRDHLEAQLQNLDFAYKDKDCVRKVEIDESLLNKIIWDSCVEKGQVFTGHRRMPRNTIEENQLLTAEERLAVYRHVVKVGHESGKTLPVDTKDDLLTTDWGSLVKKGLLDEQKNSSHGSMLEQLAALRDLKRRRQSYRAKNVHITKKSYTEIIREVIVNQMEILDPGQRSRSGSPQNADAHMEEGEQPQGSHREKKNRDREVGRESGDESTSRYRSKRSTIERWSRSRSKDKKRNIVSKRHRDRHSPGRSEDIDKDSKEGVVEKMGSDALRSYSFEDSSKHNAHGTRPGLESEYVSVIKTEVVDDEVEKEGEVGTERVGHKRSWREGSVHSNSDSDSSRHRSKKSKKSKHKKKHSKKHKKYD